MIVTFYFDVYPWTRGDTDIIPFQQPPTKTDGCKRYKVEVEIPDPKEFDHEIKTKAIQEKP